LAEGKGRLLVFIGKKEKKKRELRTNDGSGGSIIDSSPQSVKGGRELTTSKKKETSF